MGPGGWEKSASIGTERGRVRRGDRRRLRGNKEWRGLIFPADGCCLHLHWRGRRRPRLEGRGALHEKRTKSSLRDQCRVGWWRRWGVRRRPGLETRGGQGRGGGGGNGRTSLAAGLLRFCLFSYSRRLLGGSTRGPTLPNGSYSLPVRRDRLRRRVGSRLVNVWYLWQHDFRMQVVPVRQYSRG